MPVYEHTSGERQHTADGSLTDTELGVKALDPASGWRRIEPADAKPAPEPAAVDEPEPHDPPADSGDPDTPPTTKPAAARRTTTRS